MSASSLRLRRSGFNGTDRVTTETSQGFHEFLAVHPVSAGICGRKSHRFGFRPDEFGNGVDFRRASLVPIDAADDSAVIGVVPESRHSRFRLESLWIRQPFSNPILGQLSRDGGQFRPHLSHAVIAGNLVAAEAPVNSNQVAAIVERGGLGYVGTGVVTDRLGNPLETGVV